MVKRLDTFTLGVKYYEFKSHFPQKIIKSNDPVKI